MEIHIKLGQKYSKKFSSKFDTFCKDAFTTSAYSCFFVNNFLYPFYQKSGTFLLDTIQEDKISFGRGHKILRTNPVKINADLPELVYINCLTLLRYGKSEFS